VDAFRDRTFEGRVTQIRKAPERSQNVVTYTTVISTENPDLLLLPGMTALVSIRIFDSGEVLKVPNRALRYRPSSESLGGADVVDGGQAEGMGVVWVLEPTGVPEPVPIRTGVRGEFEAEMLSGNLSAGQEVIVGEQTPQH
jgi:HlyD family secretion protein